MIWKQSSWERRKGGVRLRWVWFDREAPLRRKHVVSDSIRESISCSIGRWLKRRSVEGRYVHSKYGRLTETQLEDGEVAVLLRSVFPSTTEDVHLAVVHECCVASTKWWCFSSCLFDAPWGLWKVGEMRCGRPTDWRFIHTPVAEEREGSKEI